MEGWTSLSTPAPHSSYCYLHTPPLSLTACSLNLQPSSLQTSGLSFFVFSFASRSDIHPTLPRPDPTPPHPASRLSQTPAGPAHPWDWCHWCTAGCPPPGMEPRAWSQRPPLLPGSASTVPLSAHTLLGTPPRILLPFLPPACLLEGNGWF